MENWFKSLSKKELKTWIKNMGSGVNLFFSTDEDKNNLKLAKQILKEDKK